MSVYSNGLSSLQKGTSYRVYSAIRESPASGKQKMVEALCCRLYVREMVEELWCDVERKLVEELCCGVEKDGVWSMKIEVGIMSSTRVY